MVEFYDENGTRTKWSENVDFEKYKELMTQLGYTFVGWYTRMDCNCVDACSHVVKANDFITYDHYQGNQTLYARWEKNKIIFDMGGADCEQYEQEEFSDSNKQVTVKNPTWSYEIKHIVDGERFNGVIYKEFQGWADENGNIISTKDQNGNITTIVDLSVVNMGVLKLTAVWSDYKWDVPDISISGYEKVANWYLDTYCSERIDVLDANTINRIKQNNFEIYAKKTALEYSINYTNLKDSGFVPIYNKYTVESDFNFEKNLTSTGYTFKGWYIDNYALKIESIDQIIALGLTDVTLIAKWEANSYDVTFNANGGTTKVTNKSIVYETKYGELPIPERTGYTFDGWFTASNGGMQVTENTTLQVAGNHTLFAHWTPCSYTISYDLCSSSLQSTPSISKNNTTIIFDANTALGDVPSADGYAFTGWRTENGALLTDSDGKIIATNVTGYITNGKWSISEGATVYATWIRTTPNAQITTATFSTSVYAEGTYIGVANFSITGIKVKYNGQYYIYGNAYYCGTLGTTRFNDVDSIYFKNTSNKILMGGVLHWRSSYSDNNESGVAGWDRTLGINSTNIGYRVEDPGKDFSANETIYLSVTDICVAIGGSANDLDGVPEIVTDTLSANFYTEDKDNIRITFDLIGIKVQYNNEYYLMGNAFYSGSPGGTRYNDVDGIWLKNMDKAVLLGGTMYWSGSKNDNNESGIAGYNKKYGFNSTTIRYMVEDPGKDFAGNESNIISITGMCVKIGGNASSDTVTPKISETTFSTTLACEGTAMGNITFSVVGIEVKNNGTNALYGNAYYSGTCTGSRFNDVGTLKLNSVSKNVYLGGTIHWFGSWSDNNESGIAGFDKSSSNTSNVVYLQEDPGKDYQGKEGDTEISITGICVAVN